MNNKVIFFKTASSFRAWLRKNHKCEKELHVGYYKKHSNRPSITWPQSVGETLCYGWIDGIRRRIDDDRYEIRFTPRSPRSKWSAVNVRMMGELEAAGKMTNAGRAVFQNRQDPESMGYTYENEDWKLDTDRLRAFKTNKSAWKFFGTQPPGYRKKSIGWIMSAKKEETKDQRLAQLMEASANARRSF